MPLSIKFNAGIRRAFSVVLLILIRKKPGEQGPQNQEFSLICTFTAEIVAGRNCNGSHAMCYTTFIGKNLAH